MVSTSLVESALRSLDAYLMASLASIGSNCVSDGAGQVKLRTSLKYYWDTDDGNILIKPVAEVSCRLDMPLLVSWLQ